MKTKTLIASIPLIIVLFISSASATIHCQLCGKEINGTYYQTTDGHIYCNDCWKSNTICSQCGALTRSPINVEGKSFCPECYAKLEKCSLCGKPLIGNYTQYPALGLKICPECERTKPRCDKCGIPSNKLTKEGDINLCERCAKDTEKCHCCGNPLLKNYTFFDGNSEFKYCTLCVSRFPACDDCGAPIGPDGTNLNDGRTLCPDCRRLAYFNAGLIMPIKDKVFAFVAGNMGMPVEHSIHFSLEDRNFIKTKAKGIPGDLKGLFYRKGDNYNIYILFGLREKDLIEVIAHEMAHAWQAENCRDDMPLEDQEGFAQWIGYKALFFFGLDDFAKIMTQGDNVYATGLAKMLKIEQTGGKGAVFEYIKRGK
jgi:recombinational DNA repair protein (RecF pathway)